MKWLNGCAPNGHKPFLEALCNYAPVQEYPRWTIWWFDCIEIRIYTLYWIRAPVFIVSIFILLIVCNIVLLENKEIWFEVYGLQNRRENGHLKKYLKYLTTSTQVLCNQVQVQLLPIFSRQVQLQVQVLIFSRQVQVLKYKYFTWPTPAMC